VSALSGNKDWRFLAGGGEAGRLIGAFDWCGTALGPIEHWPQSLQTMTGFLLRSPVPMVMLWGADGVMIYNDAYSVFAGGRHPKLLGSKVCEGWPEVAAFNDHVMRVGLAGGTLAYKDQELTLYRNGGPEQVFMNLDYSPVPGDDGRPAGVLAIVIETTERVMAERQRQVAEAEMRLERDRAQGVLDNMGEAFVLLDAEFRIVDLNAEAMRLENRLKSELIGKTHWEAHPNAAPEVGELYRQAMREQRAAALQYHYTWADGRETWIDMRAYPVRQGLAVFYRDVTERIQSEQRLRESDAHFRGVFNSRLTGLTIFDANSGQTLAINDAFLAMTGHMRADFEQGRWDWRQFTLPQYLHLDETAVAQARERGFWETYEKEYRRRDGSHFPARISSAPMPGRPGIVAVSVQDISDARAAEAGLRESQQRFLLAQQAAGLGVWDWNLTTNVITWSPEMYTLLDIDPQTPAQRLFEAWTLALHPEDRDYATSMASNSAQAGQGFSMDIRVIRRDGEVRWLRSQATAVNQDGRPVRLAGVNLDVTAQHQIEDALRGETIKLAATVEERTRERNRVFELSSELFAAAGFDGFLKTINPAWEKLLGYSETELLERPFITFIHPDDHAASANIIGALMGGKAVQSFEDRLLRKDGGAVWIAWTAVPEGDRFYAVGRDVTRERESQEALRQSQKMEAMGQLTGGVAHDFNNLLTPIMGALDLLQRKGVGGEREQRMIGGAAQSAERAKTLVQRLLAFARRQPLQSIPVDMGKLVGGMADLVASTIGPQIRVVLDVAPDLPLARADPNQLEMALLNLAVNARDAMPEGGTLRISAAAQAIGRQHPTGLKPGRYLNLSVSDTGLGMDEATLARAVEPFFSTKGIGKGTGLGLSMVHGLASQLGGALTIHSQPGMGTNVELLLPQDTNSPIVSETLAEQEPVVPGKGTVLLVDDEDLVRLTTADMLVDLGYAVVEAASAKEALRLLDRGLTPDIVVTDHLMPGMSGTELAQVLRDRNAQAKVLVISGYAESAGFAPDLPRLSKPFRSADLAASLGNLT
jgi:PAS domain S-box-containing protein